MAQSLLIEGIMKNFHCEFFQPAGWEEVGLHLCVRETQFILALLFINV